MNTLYQHDRVINWADTDAACIVYTGNYLPICLEAIEGWFREVLGIDWFDMNINLGIGTPFVHVEIDISAPLTPQNQLRIQVIVVRLGNKSLSFKLIGLRDPNTNPLTVFVGQFTCCFAHTQTLESISIPDEYRQRIADYLKHTTPI